jgi:hypothetical protein
MKNHLRIFLMILMASSNSATLASFAQAPAAGPSPRYSFALAYDESRQRLVLVGGFMRGTYLGDTWEWDGTNWMLVTQTGPSPRNAPAMAYDSRRKKIVLFGGDNRSGALRDTWEWDGQQWRQAANSGPPARSIHTLVYDSRRGKMVLFGGIANNALLGDTWEWDGNTWMQASTSGPAARFLHTSAYDTASGKLLIFGGSTALAPPPQNGLRGDTWEWNGSAWRMAIASGPAPRDHVAMAYDGARKKVVLFGGSANENSLGDTWEWDGQSWQQISASGPSARAGHKLVFDSKRKTVLLYGGFVGAGPTTELWEWDGSSWEMIQLTSVHESADQPQGFLLQQNYPNPFNQNTAFAFQLRAANLVNLKVYDMLGREVATLLNEWRSAGSHLVNWQPQDLAKGVYCYRLQAGAIFQTKKLIVN